MPIRINSTIVYGTYKARQRKFKVTEDGAHYVKDENGHLIPDGWGYYTMHAVWANCLCAFVYKYRDKETGEKMYRFDYEFFNDLSHARRCFEGGWGENIVSARFNIATPEGRKLAALFVQNGIKVTPYNKPLKKKITMPTITYGMFDTSNLSPEQVMRYQYMLNGEELYGEL